jgi:hypothetical protein
MTRVESRLREGIAAADDREAYEDVLIEVGARALLEEQDDVSAVAETAGSRR